MNEGEMILIHYIGRQQGEVFDVSSEEKAREAGAYSDNMDYSPIPVLLGEGYVIEGLEEELMEMEPGEEKELEIPPEKAYGKRTADDIETYPEKEFEKQDVNVHPGDTIMVGRRQGKIISKGSGRVKVDFNHPLAGKTLQYEIEVLEKVEDDEEKAEKIFKYRLGHGDIEFEDDKVVVRHDSEEHGHELPEKVKEEVRDEITSHTGYSEVEFNE